MRTVLQELQQETPLRPIDSIPAPVMNRSSLPVLSVHLLRTSFLLICAGCGSSAGMTDYSALKLVPVSGRVTLDGKPMSSVTVIFESDNGTWSSGSTDEDGRYRMQFNSEVEGVVPGRKIVRVYQRTNSGDSDKDSPSDSGPSEATKESSQRTADLLRVLPHYGRRSKLTADVHAETRELNFELRADGVRFE
jgi:hypothetical protein